MSRIVKHINCNVAELGVAPSLNIRGGTPNDWFKDQNDEFGLGAMLAQGWEPGLGAISATKAEDYPAALAEANKYREDYAADLGKTPASTEFRINLPGGQSVTFSASDAIVVFDLMYKTKGNGFKQIKYLNQTCFRRLSRALFWANVIRYKTDRDLITELPISIVEFDNEGDRVAHGTSENTLKTKGNRIMSQNELLHSSKLMYENMIKEVRFREIYGTGTGQKLYALQRLNALYSDLGILQIARTLDGFYSRLNKEEMRKLADRAAKPEEVQQYLETAKTESTNKANKMASKKDVEAMKQNPCKVIQLASEAVVANDIGRLRVLIPVANLINPITDALLSGDPKKIQIVEEAVAQLSAL